MESKFGWVVAWLVGWLVGCLVGWLMDWLQMNIILFFFRHWLLLSMLNSKEIELLDSSGSNPAEAYPQLWKIITKLTPKPYYFKRQLQSSWSSACSLFVLFFMTMKSRGFAGPTLLKTFFPALPKCDLFKNDLAVACFISTLYKEPQIERYILDLDFLLERHKLDSNQQSIKRKTK